MSEYYFGQTSCCAITDKGLLINCLAYSVFYHVGKTFKLHRKGSFFSKRFMKMSICSDFSPIFPLNFLMEIVIGWIWIQISTPSQSQAPSKNVEEKLKNNQSKWIFVKTLSRKSYLYRSLSVRSPQKIEFWHHRPISSFHSIW